MNVISSQMMFHLVLFLSLFLIFVQLMWVPTLPFAQTVSEVDNDDVNLLRNFSSSSLQILRRKSSLVSASGIQMTSNARVHTHTGTSTHTHEQRGQDQILDDWRVVTDCNMYDLACPIHKTFRPYPFLKLMQKNPKELSKLLDPVTVDFFHPEKELEHMRNLTSFNNAGPIPNPDTKYGYQEFIDPPRVSQEVKDKCLQVAKSQSLKEQVEIVIQQLHPIQVEMNIGEKQATTNFLAFTITDETYSREMLHELYQMNENVVKFGGAHFVVGMDLFTVDLACSFGYPIVYYHQNEQEQEVDMKEEGGEEGEGGKGNNEAKTKTLVQGSKFILSKMLVDMNQSFFFYEMDIWFIKSPIHILEQMKGDLLASTHQNNPFAMNIGFYAVRATAASKEYFQLCVDILRKIPDAHDQLIMQRLESVSNEKLSGRKFIEEDVIRLGEKDQIPVPDMTYPLRAEKLDPHVVVSHVHTTITEMTVAVHFLASRPLLGPFGKIMMAKETGAWYGFQNNVEAAISRLDISSASTSKVTPTYKKMENTEMGGYYKRTGNYRRYLLIDSVGTLGGHTQQRIRGYHSIDHLQWKMAILITMARHTNRILILPKVLADSDKKFVWTSLDMSSVEALGVKYRETNFPSNKKSWYSPTLPFSSVARVASYSDGTLLLQASNTTQLQQGVQGKINGWKLEHREEFEIFDGLFAMVTAQTNVHDAEALFVNPVDLYDGFRHHLSKIALQESVSKNITLALSEVAKVYQGLRWCRSREMEQFSEFVENPLTPTAVQSTHHCYRQGVPA